MLSARLALSSLWHERVHLFCNVAMIAGALVPLLVLFGVKTGVHQALMDDLLSDPNLLYVTTLGDNDFSEADRVEISGWEEVEFVVLKTRSIADDALIQSASDGRIAQATLVPSGPGDPLLPDGVTVSEGQIAVSARLAEQIGAARGTEVRVIGRTELRSPLVITATVVEALAPERSTGNVILMTSEEMDLFEAYFDGYALPQFGLGDGRPIAERVSSFEGLRLYANALENVSRLEIRVQDRFGVRTHSRAQEIEGVLALGRNLDLAFLLIASTAVVGLGAALLFSFWAEVDRKRRIFATLMLVGLSRRDIALVPLVQAAVVGAAGVAVAFILFALASIGAEAMFADRMPPGQSVVSLTATSVILGIVLPIVIVLVASTLAVRTVIGIDPAITLRTS